MHYSLCMGKRLVVVLLSLGLILSACSGNTEQADIDIIIPGSECPEVGTSKTYDSKIFTCIKLGSKLYWDNGVPEIADIAVEEPKPVLLTERQALNLLPISSDLEKYSNLIRFSTSSYDLEVGSTSVLTDSENDDNAFSSIPHSCLPVPYIGFFGSLYDVLGSSVNGKMEDSFRVAFTRSGQDVLRVYILKPKNLDSVDAFEAYKVDFSECGRFKWSMNRGYSDTNFALLYQNATASITDLTKNSLNGTLKSEIKVNSLEWCGVFKNCELYADWNASFVMKQINGYILLASLLNTTQGANPSSGKARNVSPDEVVDLMNLLNDLEAKIMQLG